MQETQRGSRKVSDCAARVREGAGEGHGVHDGAQVGGGVSGGATWVTDGAQGYGRI